MANQHTRKYDSAKGMKVVNARLPDDMWEALNEYQARNEKLDRSAIVRIGVALAIGKPELAKPEIDLVLGTREAA